MKRTISIVSCLVGLCVAAVIGRYSLMQTGHAGVVVTEPITPGNEGNGDSPKTTKHGSEDSPKAAQQVFYLDTGMAVFGANENSPCYVNVETNTLYRWKGVVLRDDQLKQTPYDAFPSGIACLNPKECKVVPVEAPIKYWQTSEGFRPGYIDRTIWTFYAWKGVVLTQKELLDKSSDGKVAIVKPDFSDQRIEVLEIEMPAHLKEKPGLWKKS